MPPGHHGFSWMTIVSLQWGETPSRHNPQLADSVAKLGGTIGAVRRRWAEVARDARISRARRVSSATHVTGSQGAHMSRYLGPLPPSRGVHRGPSTSVALQSTQFGGLTRSSSPTRS